MKKTVEQQPCEDMEAEYYSRILSIFTSFYDQPSGEDLSEFPPPKLNTSQKQEKSPAFESTLVDHRLKKLQEARNSDIQLMSNMISLKSDDLSKQFKESNTNLDETFAPERANRESKPKYLLLQEMDRIESNAKRGMNRQPLDIKTTEKLFTQRLKAAKQKGIEKARARAERQQSQGKVTVQIYESKVKPKEYTVTDKMQYAAAKSKYNNRMNYMSPNDYKKFVHKKQMPTITEDDE